MILLSRNIIALCLGTFLLQGSAQSGHPTAVLPQGTFTNLHTIPETGDVLGFEITLMPEFNGVYMVFQCAEGVPTTPIFMPITVKYSRFFSFTIQNPTDEGCNGAYQAALSSDHIQLKVGASARVDVLHKKRSFWAD